ncbi:hypothetical protein D3C80_1368630 [compost metagenome]
MCIKHGIREVFDQILVQGVDVLHRAADVQPGFAADEHVYGIRFTCSCKVFVHVAAVAQLFKEVHRIDVLREGEIRCQLAVLLTPGVRCAKPGRNRFIGAVYQLVAVHESDGVLFTVAVRVLFSKSLGHCEQLIQVSRSLQAELIRPVLAVDDTLAGQRTSDVQRVELAVHLGVVQNFRL